MVRSWFTGRNPAKDDSTGGQLGIGHAVFCPNYKSREKCDAVDVVCMTWISYLMCFSLQPHQAPAEAQKKKGNKGEEEEVEEAARSRKESTNNTHNSQITYTVLTGWGTKHRREETWRARPRGPQPYDAKAGKEWKTKEKQSAVRTNGNPQVQPKTYNSPESTGAYAEFSHHTKRQTRRPSPDRQFNSTPNP
ncbi:hypothetical protein VTI28DRAFT_3063 [Corynascus sepedonium]